MNIDERRDNEAQTGRQQDILYKTQHQHRCIHDIRQESVSDRHRPEW